jgi:hypothetical protein
VSETLEQDETGLTLKDRFGRIFVFKSLDGSDGKESRLLSYFEGNVETTGPQYDQFRVETELLAA